MKFENMFDYKLSCANMLPTPSLKQLVMSRVLVVGGTGKLGRAVVRELKRRKYWVRVLIRETSIRADEMKRTIQAASSSISPQLVLVRHR